jgi:low affinity Fe/Cu permease
MFEKLADKIATAAGSGLAFALAVTLIIIWLFVGPLFQFSDTWQLLINTPTTIVTFLLLFLVQNTQMKESLAQKVQLNEIALAIKSARNLVVSVDQKSLEELTQLEKDQILRAAQMLQGEQK